MTTTWMVTPGKVQAAIRRIVETARPRRLILFGSCVRKAVTQNSDMDILVVTGDHVKNTRRESVRIRRALRGISMPMDILVVTESQLAQWRDRPGFIYREALRQGEIVYQAA